MYRNTIANFHDPATGSYFTLGRGTGMYVDAWVDGVTNIEIHDNVIYAQGMGITVASEKGGDVS